MATIKDVALRAGVSLGTASRVLSGSSQTSPDSRARVLAAAAELDYITNGPARALRRARTDVLGLLVSDIRNPFFSELAHAAEQEARRLGYTVLLANANEDETQADEYLRIFASQRIDGLLLSPQGGLYLFLIGSGVLLVSGQKMLATMHETQLADARRDAVRAITLSRQASSAHAGSPAPTMSTVPASALSHTLAAAPPSQSALPATPAPAGPAASTTPEEAASIRPAVGAPVAPILPGTDAWHQAPAAPTSVRPALGGGWSKTRGPHRLR